MSFSAAQGCIKFKGPRDKHIESIFALIQLQHCSMQGTPNIYISSRQVINSHLAMVIQCQGEGSMSSSVAHGCIKFKGTFYGINSLEACLL